MVENERLLELLAQWDEQRRLGTEPSPEALCPDDAEAQAELRRRIARRRRIEEILEPSTLVASPGSLPPVPQLENYEILEVLGHGGMGVVYKARQRNLERLVALKMILAGPHLSPDERARFRTEAEAVARLQHDNIVRIYEIGEQAGHSYLALELVNGGTLHDFLNGRPLPPRQAAELCLTLARAVEHAHEQGIIHRDLKPANVLLQRAEPLSLKEQFGSAARHQAHTVLKITDFGLARRMDATIRHTQSGEVLGTPSYMAPEQAAGRTAEIGPAVDIHALGAMLYEMLTGRPPYVGSSLLDTLEQVCTHDVVPPSLLQPMIPRDLERICLKCLQKLPGDRYVSAALLASDLQAFLDGEPIQARDFSLMSQVARAVEYTSYSEKFALWSTVVLSLAPLPILTTLVVYLLTWGEPSFPLVVANTTAVTMALVQLVMLLGNRANMRLVPSRERRQIVTVWVSHTLAGLLLWLIIWYATPADQPGQLLLIFPCWMVLVAMANFGLAAESGIHYVIGATCLFLGVLTVFIPYAAPMLLGLFATANMTFQGLLLRWLRRQSQIREGKKTAS
ncbi:MAG: serine/threonine-protein kinase [Gemmataceae bacterium]